MKFRWVKNRKISINFNGGHITSDGGILLLQKIDNKLGLTKKISRRIKDLRIKGKVKHKIESMIRQRIYGLACNYEDLNDHNELRNDLLIQTAVGSDKSLASAPTLSRVERTIDRKALFEISNILVETFINSYKKSPKEIILDFDGTDDKVHGKQVGAMFHGYYRHKCFLPLYVFCENHLLVAYLRPGDVSDSKHSWAILKLLVKKIRAFWPNVKIIFRGDSAFCRHKMFNWCDRNNVSYITGLPGNNRLTNSAKPFFNKAKNLFIKSGEKQKIIDEFEYAAESWNKKRRVIVKTVHNIYGTNTRFIITNLSGSPRNLYEKVYCARGEMENRIKEQQLYLFSDRTSSKDWLANQFRLLLSGIAYTLLEAIRRICLKGTKIAKATCSTIRLRLLKIGAVIIRKTRTVRILLSSSYPWQALFKTIVRRLNIG